jgi:hypothetical protein
LLWHGDDDAPCRLRPPDQERADQDRQKDTVLDGRNFARTDLVDASRAERDRRGEPAKENDGRDAKRSGAIRGGPFRLRERSMQTIKDRKRGWLPCRRIRNRGERGGWSWDAPIEGLSMTTNYKLASNLSTDSDLNFSRGDLSSWRWQMAMDRTVRSPGRWM